MLEIRNGFLKAKFSNMSGGLTLTDMDTSLSSGSTFGSLAVNRGSIGFQLPQYSINVNDFFSASNCTVKNKVILSNGLNAVNINKCTIQGIEGYEVNIFDSIVQGEVKMYPTGGAWKGNLYRNTFLGDGCNVLTYKDSGSTDNKVQCAWVDNMFVGDGASRRSRRQACIRSPTTRAPTATCTPATVATVRGLSNTTR